MRRFLPLLTLTLLLTACAKAVTPEAPAPVSGPTTLRIAVFENSTADVLELDPAIAAFQTKHPQYRVEKVKLPYAPGRSPLLPQAKEGKVDLLHRHTADSNWGTEGLILDLGPLAARDGFDLAPFGDGLSARREKGKLYWLPVTADPMVIAYNPSLVKDPVPSDRWTWEQFREALGKVTSRDGKVWGLYSTMQEELAELYLLQAVQPGVGKTAAQGGREAIQLLAGMIGTDKSIPPSLSGGLRSSSWSSDDPFPTGRAGFDFLHLTMLTQGAVHIPWAAAPFPTLPGAKPVLRVRTSDYGIAANSPNTDAAWTFLQFLAGPEGAMALAKTGMLPCRTDADARAAWLSLPGHAPFAPLLERAVWHLESNGMDYNTPTGRFYTHAHSAFSGSTDWESAAAALEADLKQP